MSRYPNWELLKDTTKNKFFGWLLLIFLFSSACPCLAASKNSNTYIPSVILRNNRGSAIENLRHFKDGLLYSSQNELYFKLDKLNLNTLSGEDFSINNLIVDAEDFYLLTSTGVYKNFQKIFGKEECFHLEKNKEKLWISCKSGIYSSKTKKPNWELDNKSPQGVIFFQLDNSHTHPKYAASSQFGFFKYEKRKWHKQNIGLRAKPDGDYGFGRFLVTDIAGIETIYLPTSYGIAISNNKAKDFFIDSQGIEKEYGLISVKEINQDSKNNLILITNTGAYQAKASTVPDWHKISFKNLRKTENNFTKFSALEINKDKVYLSTDQGEIIELKNNSNLLVNKDIYGNNYFNSNELIESFLELEPRIAEVHKKSLEFAGIPTGETYSSYSKKARLRNLAPRFETYLERDNDDLLSIQTTGQDDLDAGGFSTSFDKVNQSRNNNSLNSGIRLTWDFTKLFYDEEQIDINNNARLTANIRENLLTEVTQLYFQRKELISEAISWLLNDLELKSAREILKQKLKLEESLAQLDARTGSWYSAALNKKFFSFNKKDPRSLKAMELYTNVKVN